MEKDNYLHFIITKHRQTTSEIVMWGEVSSFIYHNTYLPFQLSGTFAV